MAKPKPDFTADDLLAQISTQLSITDEGMTTKEICGALDMVPIEGNLARVRRRIADMVALGQVVYAGKKLMPSITGTMRPSPAWKLVSEEEAQ